MDPLLGRSATTSQPQARDIPKIGGSAAGFIVLVAALCLIILISLTGIVFLLRDDTPSDEELQGKSHRPRTTTYITPLEDDGSPKNSWLRRTYQRLAFARTTSSDRIPQIKVGHSRSESHASQDGWHTESLDDLRLKLPPRQNSRYIPADQLHTSVSTSQTARRLSNPNSTSTCSVRFDLHGISPTEKERSSPSPIAIFPNIHTQMSSPTSSPSSSPSANHRHSRVSSQDRPVSALSLSNTARHEQDSTRFSTFASSSIPTLTTFEGGTKFIEAF